ncbi:uncharacterized protein VNE69_03237 [Vairimorpha necatrix]|uniref:Uncharacterized protein n=1 Tax=Vairimorpha necatrix TaxID=6039 RepID=A0AAX4JAP4_9MICR
MKDLTEYYKILLSIHKNNRKESLSHIFTSKNNIEDLHPLIIKPGELGTLEYSLEFKDIQRRLLVEIREFIYYKKDGQGIINRIIETNKILQGCKILEKSDHPLQNILNRRISELLNNYIKLNLVLYSYIKDIKILLDKESLSILEEEEVDKLSKEMHNILRGTYK